MRKPLRTGYIYSRHLLQAFILVRATHFIYRECLSTNSIRLAGVLSLPVEEFLFSPEALDSRRIANTAEFVTSKAKRAYEDCSSSAGEIRVLKHSHSPKLCWYGTDHKKLARRIEAKYRKFSHLICDNDCNKSPNDAIVIAKSRSLEVDPAARTSTVLPLNTRRHFRLIPAALQDKISFEQKKDVAFWRGSTSSLCWDRGMNFKRYYVDNDSSADCARWSLVARWFNSSTSDVDVSISRLVQMGKRFRDYEDAVRGDVLLSEQLKYRYLISVEGNDVASNLKWALASNSVVLMPPPTRETFALEGRLIPWVHYVPLRRDTSDLLVKVQYCRRNMGVCQNISKHATAWVQSLADQKSVFNFGAMILEAHLDRLAGQPLIHNAMLQ